MNLRKRIVLPCVLLLAAGAATVPICNAQDNAQQQPSVSPAQHQPSAPPPQQPGSTSSAQPARKPDDISWKRFAPRVFQDQERIWLFPYSVARGHEVTPTLLTIGATAGLVALDRATTTQFRDTHAFGDFNSSFNGNNTWLVTESTPAAFYFTGLIFKNRKARETGLLAAEAFLDSQVVSLVMEDVSSRILPYQVSSNNQLGDSWFEERNRNYLSGAGGFPSGHTIVAVSIATVIAHRYKNHRWVPWVAYGLAGLDAFSRVTTLSHFPSDVFVGGVLGYVISRYVVLRHVPADETDAP